MLADSSGRLAIEANTGRTALSYRLLEYLVDGNGGWLIGKEENVFVRWVKILARTVDYIVDSITI